MKLRDDEVAEFDAKPWFRFELDHTTVDIEVFDRASGRRIPHLAYSGPLSKFSRPTQFAVDRGQPFAARSFHRAMLAPHASKGTGRIRSHTRSRPAGDGRPPFAPPASRKITRAVSAPKGKKK